MPNPKAVNEVREELKQAMGPSGQGSATMEERELAKADGGPAAKGEARAATPEEMQLPDDGTRVWNHWEDQTARELQEQASRDTVERLGVAGFTAENDETDFDVVDGPTGPTGATGVTGATGSGSAASASIARKTDGQDDGKGTAARETRVREKVS